MKRFSNIDLLRYFLNTCFFVFALLSFVPFYVSSDIQSSFFPDFELAKNNTFMPILLAVSILAFYLGKKWLGLCFVALIFFLGLLALITPDASMGYNSKKTISHFLTPFNDYVSVRRNALEIFLLILVGVALLLHLSVFPRYLKKISISIAVFVVGVTLFLFFCEFYYFSDNSWIDVSSYNITTILVSGLAVFLITHLKSYHEKIKNYFYVGFVFLLIFIGSCFILERQEVKKINHEVNALANNTVSELKLRADSDVALLKLLAKKSANNQKSDWSSLNDSTSKQLLPFAEKILWVSNTGDESAKSVLSGRLEKTSLLSAKCVTDAYRRVLSSLTPALLQHCDSESISYLAVPVMQESQKEAAVSGVVIAIISHHVWMKTVIDTLEGYHPKKTDLVIESDTGTLYKNSSATSGYPRGEKHLSLFGKNYTVYIANKNSFLNSSALTAFLVIFIISILVIGLVSALLREKRAFRKTYDDLSQILAARTKDLDDSRRQAQEIIDFSADGIVTLDEQGLVTLYNTAAEDMFGFKAKEVIGRNIKMLMPDTIAKNTTSFIEQYRLLYSKNRNVDKVLYGKRKNGDIFPLRLSLSRIKTNQGNTFVGIVSDITLQKQLEGNLLQAKKEAEALSKEAIAAKEIAEKANQTKSEFLATMSHEIRTPLNGAVGMIDLLMMDSALTEQQHRKIVLVKNTILESLDLMNDILDLSKIEAGRMELAEEPFSVNETITGVINTLASTAEIKGVQLSYNLDSACPPLLQGSPIRLRQVLINLLSNAIKFSGVDECGHGGDVKLFVDLIEESEDSACLQFTVSDNGIGISKEGQKILFEPFIQAEKNTTRRFGGTGLGLAICLKLVKLMGGKIELESEVGVGSTFFVTVTFSKKTENNLAVQNKKDVSTTLTAKKPAEESPLFFSDPPHILLAEDNELNQEVISKLLATFNCHVTVADDGLMALKLWREKNYDLILTDCHMPKMNGYELTKIIRLEESDKKESTTIIAVTASTSEDERNNCLKVGMDAYISKPIDLKELQKLLTYWLGESNKDEIKDVLIKKEKVFFDKSILPAFVGDSQELIKRHSDEFVDKANALMARIWADFEKDNLVGLALSSHQLRSAAVLVGAMQLGSLCRAIELSAKSGAYSKDLIVKTQGMLERVLEYLPNAFPKEIPFNPKEIPSTYRVLKDIDVVQGLKTAMGDKNFYKHLLGKFRKTQQNFLEVFQLSLIGKESNDEAIRLAHTLKGVSANIGAKSLERAALKLESACIRDADEYLLDELALAVDDELQKVILQIQEFETGCIVTAESEKKPIKSLLDFTAQIKSLLLANDAQAKAFFSQYSFLIKEKVTAEAFGQIEQSIDDYNFEKALSLLDEIPQTAK